jgi:hypothetical protein
MDLMSGGNAARAPNLPTTLNPGCAPLPVERASPSRELHRHEGFIGEKMLVGVEMSSMFSPMRTGVRCL